MHIHPGLTLAGLPPLFAPSAWPIFHNDYRTAVKLIIRSDRVLAQVQIEPGSCVEHTQHMTGLSSCLTFNAVAGSRHKSQQRLNKNGVYLLCADYKETALYVVFPISGWINYIIRRVKMNSFNKGDCPRPVSELIFSSSRAWPPSNICNKRQSVYQLLCKYLAQ